MTTTRTDTYYPTRPVMTAAELATHKINEHGRDYSKSDDGYGDMEVASTEGWRALASWGSDGWDLGDWPYVVISVRNVGTTIDGRTIPAPFVATGETYAVKPAWEMRQTCEGDTTVYRFESAADREAAIDYLFAWYAAGQEWANFDRAALDAGTYVPIKYRGPYSSGRCG